MPDKKVIKWYGWVPDSLDKRDRKFVRALKFDRPEALPVKVDLSPGMPPCYDQGNLGSCTANAIAGALQYCSIKQGEPLFNPSRLMIYYNERVIEDTVGEDAGAMLRDGIKTLIDDGACDEIDWPYQENMFATKPSQPCYDAATTHEALVYRRIQPDLQDMKACLAGGFPFVIGISVYDAFESDEVAATGVVPLPGINDAPIGGHAILCVGYSDNTQRFKLRNSWGSDWGQGGYFEVDYAYLTDPDLADDRWEVTLIK